MEPTLKPNDRLLVALGSYKHAAPQRGDIVTFTPPFRAPDPFIKRVIAIPGDLLTSRYGRIIINGKPLREPYINGRADYEIKSANQRLYVTIPGETAWLPVKSKAPCNPPGNGSNRVPPDCFVLLGDNRSDSEDSHVFGFIARKAIEGKMVEKL